MRCNTVGRLGQFIEIVINNGNTDSKNFRINIRKGDVEWISKHVDGTGGLIKFQNDETKYKLISNYDEIKRKLK